MMVTDEYHNEILLALYIHVLHTEVNHILLHNGNKNADPGTLRPDITWNSL